MDQTNMIAATSAAIKECPREIFNLYLFACTCIWSFSGVAKGFDEGMYEWPYHCVSRPWLCVLFSAI
jgi:hypothetical protein